VNISRYYTTMRVCILIISALLTSCDLFYPKVYDVPTEVEPYIQEYRTQANKHGRYVLIDNIEVNFSTFMHDDNPAVVKTRHETIVMTINREIWDSYENDTTKREAVIFHELTHKVLDRRHEPDSVFSLMVKAPDLRMYKFQRDSLLKELFSNTSSH